MLECASKACSMTGGGIDWCVGVLVGTRNLGSQI